jgi:hypothetical protein
VIQSRISSIEGRIVDALAASALSVALQEPPPAVKGQKPSAAASAEAVRLLAVACYLRE